MMTTPERFRKRQLVEGLVLMLLAIFTVIQSVYFSVQNRDQQECFERKFTELNKSLIIRGKLGGKETHAERQIWMVYARAAGLIKDPEHPHLDPKDRQQLNSELVKALLNYKEVTTEIQQDRKEHPLPPYPLGACNPES